MMRRAERGQGCQRQGPIGRATRATVARAAHAPWAWSAATVVLLAGCSGAPRQAAPPTLANEPNPSAGESDWVWTEAGEDVPDNSLAALLAQQAADLERMTAGGPVNASGAVIDRRSEPRLAEPPAISLDRPIPGATDEPHTPSPNDALLRALSLAGGGSGVLAQQALPTRTTPAEPPLETASAEAEAPEAVGRSQRIAELANELAALLKEESAELDDPTRALVPAALLGSIAGGVIDEADLPGGGALMLTDSERASLITLRELAVRLVGPESQAAGDPQRIREVLLSTAAALREHARVRIARAELCVRAPGFGSYVPLERRTFLAGRTNRVVVYAEVEHFGLRPATADEATTPGDSVAAELTQELELFLAEGDPQPTWQRRIDWLPKTSRRSFHDMFVATAIDLPSTLSVGEYHLKIRLIDDVTGAQDETIIPIRLVADASVLQQNPIDRSAGTAGEPRRPSGFTPSFAAGDRAASR